MRLTTEEMRARMEEALRALAPGPYERLQDDDGFFLTLPGPKGISIDYFCDESNIQLEFGPSGAAPLEYNTSSESGDDFTEGDLKAILADVIRTTLDITSERVFTAVYRNFLVSVGGIHPAEEFETLRKKKGFESASWNGRYTENYSA
jgi:hypothetical protein